MTHISRNKAKVKPRTDARVERSRSMLRHALLELLDEHAFDELTIRDITTQAGAGYATFFRHYPDKAALLDDVAADGIRELLERSLPILAAVDTRSACAALCGYIDERKQLWSVLLTGGAASKLREEFIRQGRAVAAAYPKSGKRRRSQLPIDLAVVVGVSGTMEILGWWLAHRNQFTVDKIADMLDRLVIAPILRE
jgi:AcrR family transcriptional regulator